MKEQLEKIVIELKKANNLLKNFDMFVGNEHQATKRLMTDNNITAAILFVERFPQYADLISAAQDIITAQLEELEKLLDPE